MEVKVTFYSGISWIWFALASGRTHPYVSSAKKVSMITWFQEYFEREENKEILVHAGI